MKYLLVVWFGLWVWKYYRPLTYKRYMKQKLEGVKQMLWDLEFKKFKSLQIREEVRMTYDSLKAKLLGLEGTIKIQKELKEGAEGKLSKDEAAKLDDQKVLMERDIKRYEEQMTQIDTDVFGLKPSAENPNGANGIEQQIDSLQELKAIIIKDLK